jgi:hypothetical protein
MSIIMFEAEKLNLAKLTRPVRHGLVRRIAPKLYARALLHLYSESSTPRPSTCFVKMKMGRKPLTVAEIGVDRGMNSESIMRTLNVQTLFAIDPYRPYFQRGSPVLTSSASAEAARVEAARRLAPFGKKIKFMYETSGKAASSIPNGLDFVYVDGNHQYESVKQDIELYYPKLSPDGIIGGHDFSSNFLDVIRAVTEFAASRKLQLMVEPYDWWLSRDLTWEISRKQ